MKTVYEEVQEDVRMLLCQAKINCFRKVCVFFFPLSQKKCNEEHPDRNSLDQRKEWIYTE